MAQINNKTIELSDLTSQDISESIVSSGEQFLHQVIDSIEFHHCNLSKKAKAQISEKLNDWLQESAKEFTVN